MYLCLTLIRIHYMATHKHPRSPVLSEASGFFGEGFRDRRADQGGPWLLYPSSLTSEEESHHASGDDTKFSSFAGTLRNPTLLSKWTRFKQRTSFLKISLLLRIKTPTWENSVRWERRKSPRALGTESVGGEKVVLRQMNLVENLDPSTFVGPMVKSNLLHFCSNTNFNPLTSCYITKTLVGLADWTRTLVLHKSIYQTRDGYCNQTRKWPFRCDLN